MWKEIGDQVLHVLISLVGLSLLAFTQSLWAFTWAGFWFALTREDAQHRPDEGWSWPLNGWLRWVDIATGTLGGFLVWLAFVY